MRCHACGMENSDEHSFCVGCGVRLGPACLQCGYRNAPGGWVDTTIDFDLERDGEQTIVRFAHRGYAQAERHQGRPHQIDHDTL